MEIDKFWDGFAFNYIIASNHSWTIINNFWQLRRLRKKNNRRWISSQKCGLVEVNPYEQQQQVDQGTIIFAGVCKYFKWRQIFNFELGLLSFKPAIVQLIKVNWRR